MTWFEALILGLVQGLTEFLPVSSSGHLEIGKVLLNVEVKESLSFTVLVHFATVLSTITVFRRDIQQLAVGVFAFQWNEETRYLAKILVSMIPVLIVGILFREEVESLFSGNLTLVGSALLVTAALLISTQLVKPGTKKIPFLGICLGMQLMCRSTEEGPTTGLGIFDVEVLRFDGKLKVPQIGWNSIHDLKSPLFEGVRESEFIYLVHSYYAPLCAETIAVSDYGLPYSAALARDNFFGVQFHPEKSGQAGAVMLRNFLKL